VRGLLWSKKSIKNGIDDEPSAGGEDVDAIDLCRGFLVEPLVRES